ncbi:hypothetical protein SAZ11_00405 [Streptomyces sp. FXJ1.4098]|nr:hypothetical protein [Streptomyces sp. FXJ1.4098]
MTFLSWKFVRWSGAITEDFPAEATFFVRGFGCSLLGSGSGSGRDFGCSLLGSDRGFAAGEGDLLSLRGDGAGDWAV